METEWIQDSLEAQKLAVSRAPENDRAVRKEDRLPLLDSETFRSEKEFRYFLGKQDLASA